MKPDNTLLLYHEFNEKVNNLTGGFCYGTFVFSYHLYNRLRTKYPTSIITVYGNIMYIDVECI